MKSRICFLWLISLSFIGICQQTFTHNQSETPETKWGDFFVPSLVGNGRLGIEIFKQFEGKGMVFTLGNVEVVRGDYDISRSKDPIAPLWATSRIMIGRFLLSPTHPVLFDTFSIDRKTGTASGRMETEKGVIHWMIAMLRSPSCGFLCLKMEGDEPMPKVNFIAGECRSPQTFFQHAKTPSPYANTFDRPKKTILDGYTYVWQDMGKGGSYTTAWDSIAIPYDERWDYVIPFTNEFVAGEENRESSNKKAYGRLANVRLRLGKRFELDEILTDNQIWWNFFWERSSASFPIPILDDFYKQQLYLLGAGTDPRGRILDTRGPWLSAPTAYPAVVWGEQIQQTYAFCFQPNYLDFFAPVPQAFLSSLERLARNTGLPRNDVAAIGQYSSYKLISPIDNALSPSLGARNLMWALYYYYEYCRYTQSAEELFLRFLPLLERNLTYYCSFLKKDKEGKYHLPRALLSGTEVSSDPTVDLSLLLWGIRTLEDICFQADQSCTTLEKIEKIKPFLPALALDQNGLMLGEQTPLSSSLSDYSHLIAFYPLQLLSWDEPQHRSIIRKSFNHWVEQGDSAWNVGTYASAATLAAWMQEGDLALDFIQTFFRKGLMKNGFSQDDLRYMSAGMGIAYAMQAMLLQTINGVIKVFPAVPSAWKNVAFEQWRTPGEVFINAKIEEGKCHSISLSSPHKQTVRVSMPLPRDRMTCSHPGNIRFVEEKEGRTTWEVTFPQANVVIICAE